MNDRDVRLRARWGRSGRVRAYEREDVHDCAHWSAKDISRRDARAKLAEELRGRRRARVVRPDACSPGRRSKPRESSELISGGDNYSLRLRTADFELAKRVHQATGNAHIRCHGGAASQLDGNWHHVAAVIDALALHIYFDGTEVCLLADANPIVYDRGQDLFVGRHGDGSASYDFDGNLDDVRIYARALSPAEIAALARGAP